MKFKKHLSLLIALSLGFGSIILPTASQADNTTSDSLVVTADKTAQWTRQESKANYDLKIHGWEKWECAAYMGFALPDDLNKSEIKNATLVLDTKSYKYGGETYLYASEYGSFENNMQYEGDNVPAYTDTEIVTFTSPTAVGDFEINITDYIKSISTSTAAFRIDVKSQNSNNMWVIGSCNNGGIAPKLVLDMGGEVNTSPLPTTTPTATPSSTPTPKPIPTAKPTSYPVDSLQNPDFENGLEYWTTTGTVETSADKQNGTGAVKLSATNSSVSQTITGLTQGSYTLNVWVKGQSSGNNTAYIKASNCGGPDTTSTVDVYISNTSWTQISLRNVLVYNGQCTVTVNSGNSTSMLVDNIELTMDSNDNNPVSNWNFETENFEGWKTTGEVTVSDDSDTGSVAAKLSPNSEIYQKISVKPNTRYIATVRAKVDMQDTWKVTPAYNSKNQRTGETIEVISVGDRINLGVRNSESVVLRQAPAGVEGYCLLTIAFTTGENDNEVTLYANTIYDDNYTKSVSLCGDMTDPDKWQGNKGFAYVDNFDVFEKDDTVITGTDVSYLSVIENLGGRYFANGVQQDCLRIMSNHGVNAINGMIFVHGGANAMKPNTNSIALTMPTGFDKYYWYNLAKRANELDMDYMANFMLSDVWMNAVSAYTPIDWMKFNKEKNIWENQSLDEMTTTMYNYIRDFIEGLVEQGTEPIAVKIGNEEDGGICWAVGKNINSEGFKALINAGYDAVHDVLPDVPVYLHTYKGYDPNGAKGFFQNMINNGVNYDGRAYSIYGNRDIYQILNVMKQDVSIDPYSDTLYVETGYTFTEYNADYMDETVDGAPKNMARPEYWAVSPNGQYNYLLDYAQSFRDIPNPHSVMRGFFYWASEWYAMEGAGWVVGEGNTCERRTLFNNGDVSIKEMGSYADGKQGDMLEGMYAYLWRGHAKNKEANAKTSMKSFGNYSVEQTEPTSIKIEQGKVSITEGESERLHITINPTGGIYDWKVNWTSSDETVATVGVNGFVTGLKPGKTTITATTVQGGLIDSVEITVTESVKTDSISITADGFAVDGKSYMGVITGDNIKFKTAVSDNAENKTVKYTSSNPTVASFMSETWNANIPGILYQQTNATQQVQLDAKSAGKTIITVETTDGAVRESFELNVTDEYVDEQVTGIVLSEQELMLEALKSKSLTASVYPKNAVNSAVTWSSSDTSVATVNSDGKVTAIQEGNAVITAQTADGKFSASCNLTITPTDELGREIIVGDGITQTDDMYIWPSGESTLDVTFTVDKGVLLIEFDMLLRKEKNRYSRYTISDINGTPLITWSCNEYGGAADGSDMYYVQVGDKESTDKSTATKGTIRDTASDFSTYTHFKNVIDIDNKTVSLYVGGEEIATGSISSVNATKLSIYSNHSSRTLQVKDISIALEGSEPEKEADITSFEYDGGNQNVLIKSKKSMDGILIHAQYNENGSLKAVTYKKIALKIGENSEYCLATSGDKLMLWNSIEGMIPLTDSLLIE